MRRDHQHFEPAALAEPPGKALCDRRRGDKLVLDVNRALGGIDGIEKQPLRLADLLAARVTRLRPCDADIDAAEVGPDAFRPGIALRLDIELRAGGGGRPALAGDLGQRMCCLAVHHHLHVVERLEGMAGRIHPGRIVGGVRGGVPAADRQVESAAERQRIVDHNDLLMLRAAERHDVVERKTDLLGSTPLQ